MGVGFGIGFDRFRGTTVGVTFPKYGVYSTSFDLVITSFDSLFFFRSRSFRIGGEGIALFLQFGNGRLELRYRGADIGQFDDIGLRGSG